jgi:hypothetical protein
MKWYKLALWPIQTMARACVTLVVFWSLMLGFWLNYL